LGRREEKREATRQEILNAARELFQKKGYDETSIDEIVIAANLAKGSFYYHFDSKESLVRALQKAIFEEAANGVKERIEKKESPLKILFWFLAETGHWTEQNPEFARAIFAARANKFMMGAQGRGRSRGKPDFEQMKEHFEHVKEHMKEHFRDRMREPHDMKHDRDCKHCREQHDHEHSHGSFMTVLKDLVARAQQANEIRSDVAVEEVLRVFIPVIMASQANWLFKREGSLVDLLNRSLELLLDGLKPRGR
jgi:AcrR family transcriptional regulator